MVIMGFPVVHIKFNQMLMFEYRKYTGNLMFMRLEAGRLENRQLVFKHDSSVIFYRMASAKKSSRCPLKRLFRGLVFWTVRLR